MQRRFDRGDPGFAVWVPVTVLVAVLHAAAPGPTVADQAAARGADGAADRGADRGAAKKRLDDAGLKVSGGQVVLAEEPILLRDLGRSTTLRAAMQKAARDLAAYDGAVARGRDLQTKLRGDQLRLNGLLAGSTNADPAAYNRLVASVNTIQAQLGQIEADRDKVEEQGRTLRAAVNEAREAYLQHVLDLRKRADALEAAYAARGGDEAVRTAVAAAADAAGKELAFGPGSGFRAALKKLADLEEGILSESVPLVRDRGTLAASVVVNEGKPRSMIVDSGCSTLLVPAPLATEFDVVPTVGDEEVQCFMADGRVVRGVRKTLRSVRVGRFTVDNVECVVLGPEAVNAELLLGMGFLRNFKFEIDADAATLSLVRIDGK